MKKSVATKNRTKFNVWDIVVITISTLLVVSLLIFSIFGITHKVSDDDYVKITYNRDVIYYERITKEQDPLVINVEDGVNGNEEKGIKGIGKEFQFYEGARSVSVRIKNNTIQVIQETSKNKICSRQGVVKYANTPIICLPNHITVVIESFTDSDGGWDV